MTLAAHDRVARQQRRGGRWELGTVTAADEWLMVRWDDTTAITVRHPDAADVVPVDDVPIDERWWAPESVRDQLVRQEAAERLRAMAEVLPTTWVRALDAIDAIAEGLADLVDSPEGIYADIARALLAPAPVPANSP